MKGRLFFGICALVAIGGIIAALNISAAAPSREQLSNALTYEMHQRRLSDANQTAATTKVREEMTTWENRQEGLLEGQNYRLSQLEKAPNPNTTTTPVTRQRWAECVGVPTNTTFKMVCSVATPAADTYP